MSALHEDLLALRSEFPILERTTYLINNSLGAMPRTVHDDLATFAREWEERGVRAWSEGWWEMPVTTGDLLAPILGPTLGGWITDNYSWRWIFYLNLPVGMLSLFLMNRFVFDPHYVKRGNGRVDAGRSS